MGNGAMEVMEVENPAPNFGRPNTYTIARGRALVIAFAFIAAIIFTGLLVYYLRPCNDDTNTQSHASEGDFDTVDDSFNDGSNGREKDLMYIRLPRSVVPDSYDIKLIPFIWPGNFTFHGQVQIVLNITEDTKSIVLHAASLDIDLDSTTVHEYPDSVELSVRVVRIERQYKDEKRDFHVIDLRKMLKRGRRYILHMKFVGFLTERMAGFYRSSYVENNQTRWIAASQFQPTDARRVFPCFDEPALKATFQISIARPSNMTAISNMPKKIIESEPVEGLPWYVWDHFERTLPMSTYIGAIVVSDFPYISSKQGNFNVWARKDAIRQAEYSLSIGPQILKFYEDFFQIKFPLPKIDMIALPDFPAGAMENWGLITYKETTMLYQEGVSNTHNKLYVATVVSHELSHQWFGNLVTPSWWGEVWLNEGFASYVEYIGVDAVEPSWKALELFVVDELHDVFALDALASSHPIVAGVVFPDEIHEIFDRISYSKGGAIIRMMDHFLGRKTFQSGLTNYLKGKEYKNADQDDLWEALTKQAYEDKVFGQDVTVKQIMDTWTLQTGFPVVTVMRDYNTGAAHVTQSRFMLRNHTNENSLWWIPLSYTIANNPNFNDTSTDLWMKGERFVDIDDLGARSEDWVIFNVMETGYYRVNYDPTNWKLIIQQLNSPNRSIISTTNRAQLIDDALNLARAGHLDYSIALNVTSYLSEETEYLPWKAAFTAFSYLENMLYKFPAYDRFREHVLRLLENVYQKIGFEHKSTDSMLTIFTRTEVLTWACTYGHEDCVRNALRQFGAWRKESQPDSNNPISPDLKPVIYCTAIRYGGRAEWEFVWQRYLKANVGSEKDLLLNALGCTKETWLLSRYLYMATEDLSKIRKHDVVRVFSAVSNNVNGQAVAFEFLINQWDFLNRQFGHSIMSISHIVKSTTKRFNTKREFRDLREFALAHKHRLGSAQRAVDQAIEQSQANIRWLERNIGHIQNWLIDNISL